MQEQNLCKNLFKYVIIYTDISIHTNFSTYTFKLTMLQYFCCCLMLALWTSLGPKRIPALPRLWKDFFQRRQQAMLSIRYSRCKTEVFQLGGFLLLGQEVWLRWVTHCLIDCSNENITVSRLMRNSFNTFLCLSFALLRSAPVNN